jgi:hypothetical protein
MIPPVLALTRRGAALQRRRWRLGITLSDLSLLIGTSLPRVSEAEVGYGCLSAGQRAVLQDRIESALCALEGQPPRALPPRAQRTQPAAGYGRSSGS